MTYSKRSVLTLAEIHFSLMDAKEILRCVVQIDKLNAEGKFNDMSALLEELDKRRVSAEQLQTTDVVKVLYQVLKRCKNENAKKAIKAILAKWKKEYSKEKDCKVESTKSQSESLDEQANNPETENGIVSSELSSVRSKCVQLLLSAICLQPGDRSRASKLSEDIEGHIHHLHGSNISKYKNCVRSKISNLKHPRSSHLRAGLLRGSLSPRAFAEMSTEEMASPDLRRLRQAYASQSVRERQLPQSEEGTPTSRVRCERCGGAECKVTQVSRGALFLPAWVERSGPDDDALTFVTCGACGQQWYHNNWLCL